jgi:transcriptional regulator GlxA family with amidase domain
VQHYADDLTFAKLVEIACLTPEHLSRLFRRHLDNTPMNYLWQVRVEQSVLRLRHTGLAAEEIAYQCGFKSAAHFSNKVRAMYGQTPTQIRLGACAR